MPKTEPALTPSIGLRERKKEAKRQRIMEAAARLFAQKGYDSVTANELARAADVGVGTLFRYAGSKAELLMAVIGEKLADGIDTGIEHARKGRTVVESILEILRPLAEESMLHPENMVVYAKGALFGSSHLRSAASASVAAVEGAIAEVLRLHGATPRSAQTSLDDVAHAIYSTLFVDIVRVGAGSAPIEGLPGQVRRSAQTLVTAMLKE